MNNISTFLSHIGLIKRKYDEIAQIRGDNYSIFNILGVQTDELKHSKFLGTFN